MIFFTLKEFGIIAMILKWYRTFSVKTGKRKEGDEALHEIDVIVHKCNEIASGGSFGYEIPEGKQKWIQTVVDDVRKLAERYSQCKDTSLIFEYDDMKKKCALLYCYLEGLRAEFDAGRNEIKEDLHILLAKIAEEYQTENPSLSNTAAEKKALMDDRYTMARTETNLYIRYANMIKGACNTADKLGSFFMQSVSLGRVGMVKESYQE